MSNAPDPFQVEADLIRDRFARIRKALDAFATKQQVTVPPEPATQVLGDLLVDFAHVFTAETMRDILDFVEQSHYTAEWDEAHSKPGDGRGVRHRPCRTPGRLGDRQVSNESRSDPRCPEGRPTVRPRHKTRRSIEKICSTHQGETTHA